MDTDRHLIELLSEANPVPDGSVSSRGPDGEWLDERIFRRRRRFSLRPERWARPVIGFVAAAFTLLAFVVIVLLDARPELVDEPVAVTPTTGVATSTTRSTTTTSTEPIRRHPDVSLSIHRTVESGSIAGGSSSVQAMSSADGSIFLLGFEDIGEEEYTDWIARMWISPDGTTWRQADIPELEVTPGMQNLFGGVAFDGERLVATGFSQLPGDAARPLIVISDDHGATWQVVDTTDLGKGRIVSILAPAQGGFIAAGNGVWRSPDGLNWQRVSDEGRIQHLVEFQGRFVGVGQYWDQFSQAAAWVSDDGTNWTRHIIGEGIGETNASLLMTVIEVDGRLVAGGMMSDGGNGGDAAMWTSNTGAVWQRVPHDPVVLGGGRLQRVGALVEHDGLLFAFGTESSSVAWGVTWLSADGGNTWIRHQPDDGEALGRRFGGWTEVPGAVLHDGRLFVGGSEDEGPVVWSVEIDR